MSRPMPRLFLVRHGETEWSQNGRHTGRTDIPLTARGESQVQSNAISIVGDSLVIDPKNLGLVLVSPRQRAHKTFHLLFDHLREPPPHIVTEEVREWDYGDYEGLKTPEIKEKNSKWNIWKDGCPGGESVEEMQARVDSVISKVREHHQEYVQGGSNTRDIVIVAHGHFNRVCVARWLNFPLHFGTQFNVEPGSVSILGYAHNSLEEPTLNALNLYANVI